MRVGLKASSWPTYNFLYHELGLAAENADRFDDKMEEPPAVALGALGLSPTFSPSFKPI